MGLIDNTIEYVSNALRSKDTVFLKESTELEEQYNALNKLNKEYPNNKFIQEQLKKIKKGFDGENEIAYQLKKSHIGMYVLRDVKVKYGDLTAQIDYVIITPIYVYYLECKNISGNITVNENGDFIKELNINGKKIKKGMPSPLRQVEAQREVVRKIWEQKSSKLTKLLASNNYEEYRKVLVVVANEDTILNTSKAPKEIKSKVIRADNLIRQITYDINHRKDDDYLNSQKNMEKIAKSYLEILDDNKKDYYNYYKNLLLNDTSINVNDLRVKLINFRKKRSIEMNIPAYYIFTNEELEKLIKLTPKTIEELNSLNILSDIKIKTHGTQIINVINSN